MSDLRTALTEAFEKHSDDAPDTTLSAKEPEVTQGIPQGIPQDGGVEPKADKPRDEAGKFAKAEKEPDDAAPSSTEPAPLKAPSSWKPDAQAAWLKAARGEILTSDEARLFAKEAERREGDYHRGIQEYKPHSERARQYDSIVAPYQATLKQLGIDAPTAISKLLQADYTLRTSDPTTKAAYLRQLATQYGVDLDQSPQVDPYTQQLLMENQRLQQERMLWQNNNQIQESEQVGHTLAEFGSGKPHFDAVRNDMADLLEARQAKSLDEAYEKAVWLNPDVRKSLIENERAETLKKVEADRQAQRAKSAAVSVKGSAPTSVGSQPLKGSLRDIIASQVYRS